MRYYDDARARALVAARYPDVVGVYDALPKPVERADLFRYLVLHAEGGAYGARDRQHAQARAARHEQERFCTGGSPAQALTSLRLSCTANKIQTHTADTDVECMQPLDVWLGGHTELVVGVEQEFESVRSAVSRSYARVRQFQQWAIVAAKGHAMMRRIADRVVEAVTAEQQRNDEREGEVRARPASSGGGSTAGRRARARGGGKGAALSDRATLERTGPGAWTDEVAGYAREAVASALAADAADADTTLSSSPLSSPPSPTPLAERLWLLPRVATAAHPAAKDGVDPRSEGVLMLHHFAGSWKDVESMTYLQRWLRRHLWARLAWAPATPSPAATEAAPTPLGHPLTVRVPLSPKLANTGQAAQLRSLMLLVDPMATRQGYGGADAGASLSAWGAWQGGFPPGERPGLLDVQLGLLAAATPARDAASDREDAPAGAGRFVELGNSLGISSLAMGAAGVDALFLSADGERAAAKVRASAALSGLSSRIAARAVLPGRLGADAAAFLFGSESREGFRAAHFEGTRGLRALSTILEATLKSARLAAPGPPPPLTGVTGLISSTQTPSSVISTLSALAAGGLDVMRHAGRVCNAAWQQGLARQRGDLPDISLAYAEDVDAWIREHARETKALVTRLPGQPWPKPSLGSAPREWCKLDTSHEGLEAFAHSLARLPEGLAEVLVATG